MISFTLKCEKGHRFDSWFASNAAFEKLAAAGLVTCVDCGSTTVQKALMAPAVTIDRAPVAAGVPQETAPAQASDREADVSAPSPGPNDAPLRALARLRKHVEENADYVGRDFSKEVRAMDDGSKPNRPVWGEVDTKEARALIEDGLPVAPLPFGPRKKSN